MSKFSTSALLQPGEDLTDEQLQTQIDSIVADRQATRLSRRNFLATAGALGAAGLAACGGNGGDNGLETVTPTPVTPPTTTSPSLSDVLNFALNLEYLEATFYLTAVYGTGLSTTDMGTSPGTVTGGAKVNFQNQAVEAAAVLLASDEQAHVQFIRSVMGTLNITPVGMPALNLAALGAVTNDYQFLNVARALETTGVSAYEGAVTFPSLIASIPALQYAVDIHATEGQHESLLRQLIITNNGQFTGTTGVTLVAVDSNDQLPFTVSGSTTTLNIFNTSPTTGLYTARTSSQVLQIVYATTSTGVTSGGFYPNGLNGNIKST